MSTRRHIITGLTVALVLLVLTAIGYLSYRYIFYPTAPAESAIPRTALAVMKVHDPLSLTVSLEKQNKIWKELLSIEPVTELAEELNRFSAILEEENITTGYTTHISLIEDADSARKFVYIVELPGRKEERAWMRVIRKYSPHESHGGGFWLTGNKVAEAGKSDSLANWYYSIKKGLFIASSSEALVGRFTDLAGRNGGLMDDPAFVKINRTAGKKVDANIFFRYHLISDAMAETMQGIGLDTRSLVTKFASWTGLDLILKEDEVLLTGYSLAEKNNTYLGFLEDQDPTGIDMIGILPFNTESIFWIGKSNPDNYRGPGRKEFISYGGELLESPFNGIESAEMAKVRTWETSGKASAFYIIVKKKNDGSLKRFLSGNSSVPAQGGYKDHPLRKTGALSGKSIFCVSNKYYTEHSEYYIFTDDLGSLQSYISTLVNGKTLDVSENFKVFSDNISEEGNIFFYLNTRHAVNEADKYLQDDYSGYVNNAADNLRNLQGLAFQYSKLNGMFLTSVYLRHNENYREEDLSVWKTDLEAPVRGQPYLILDHRAGKLKIIAFDENNRMYLVDHYGNILWDKQIAEKPLSGIYQVDYYKNGKIQYLFNTENYVYLIDLLGRTVDNYPIKLNKKATGSLALFDYGNDKDYRVLIPSEDKVIYNYNIKGNRISGWVNPKLPDISVLPAQHLVVGRKDYIILRDIRNNILITNRRGKKRIAPDEDIRKAPDSKFYVNRTNSKGIIITTNIKGHLTYIGANGKVQYTVFGDFSPDHYFLYEDFDNNGHNDFIYLDHDRLTIFDRFKRKIFEYTFPGNITSAPKVFENSNGRKYIGVVLASNSKLYLFDSKGDATITSGLYAETPFTVGSLEQDGTLNLVTGAGNVIYNYIID